MIIEAHNNLQSPIRISATRVVILSDDNTPIAFTVEITKGHWRHFRVGDPDFAEQLLNHGILQTVVTSTLDPKTLLKK